MIPKPARKDSNMLLIIYVVNSVGLNFITVFYLNRKMDASKTGEDYKMYIQTVTRFT